MRACSVIDMFCGIGGLTHGFIKEGFSVIAGFDIDESCQYPYEQNNKARFICKKIEDVKTQDIMELYPSDHIKILVGCAPCQPFSKYQQKQGTKNEKWSFLKRLIRQSSTGQSELPSVTFLQLKQEQVAKMIHCTSHLECQS